MTCTARYILIFLILSSALLQPLLAVTLYFLLCENYVDRNVNGTHSQAGQFTNCLLPRIEFSPLPRQTPTFWCVTLLQLLAITFEHTTAVGSDVFGHGNQIIRMGNKGCQNSRSKVFSSHLRTCFLSYLSWSCVDDSCQRALSLQHNHMPFFLEFTQMINVVVFSQEDSLSCWGVKGKLAWMNRLYC